MTQIDEMVRLAKLGRRAEQRAEAAKGCLAAIVVAVFVALLRGWLLMLAVDVVHDHWLPGLPEVGYWVAVAVVALLGWLLPSWRKKGDES